MSEPTEHCSPGCRDRPELIGPLYERHAPAVYRFLSRRAGSAAAEDLLSEVFVAALQVRKRVTAHDSGSALPWLYGIAANVLRRHFREAAVAGAAAHNAGMDWDAVEAQLDAQAQRGQLRGALSVLSPAERDLLLLVAWEGLSPPRRPAPWASARSPPAAGCTGPGSAPRGRCNRAAAGSPAIPPSPS